MSSQIFLHDHPDFPGLLSIVANDVGVAEALVEKDYWVTHTLWSLTDAGLTVLFKGGTSLSKGYGIIERFSEDLDVKIESQDLPKVSSWTSSTEGARESRRRFFDALANRIVVPGATVRLAANDDGYRNALFKVEYRGVFSQSLPSTMKTFVQIELGSARVNPGEERLLSSWVHDRVGDLELATSHRDNRPLIHCVDPRVTLLEKIEAIARGFHNLKRDAASFVRHYEDAWYIIERWGANPQELRELLAQMQQSRDIKKWPEPADLAFNPAEKDHRWESLQASWEAIELMFWGRRVALEHCAQRIRGLLTQLNKKP